MVKSCDCAWPWPGRGTRSSLALVRAAVRWIDHGYEYEGARLEER